jgi:hypothetical protein
MKKLLKGYIIKWLDERALRLPHSVREKLADHLKVDVALVYAVEEAVREHIINSIQEW